MKRQKTAYPLNVWLALSAVYVIWGSTYLAIRFAVETIPPFIMAGTRFITSGLILYWVMRWRGEARPTLNQWKSAAVVSFFLLVVANGGVSWAELKVPSGVTALLVGSVPLWVALLQWGWKGEARPGWKVWAGIGLGTLGIALLIFSRSNVGLGQFDLWGSLLLVGTSLAWAFGSLYSRTENLPPSALLATSMEMLTGGVMQLIVSVPLGEYSSFHFSNINVQSFSSWVYLTLIGSLVGFTSYIWVLQKATPTLASTYAFVNPVIAVFLGWLFAGEKLTVLLFFSTGLIVAAVVLITISQKKKRDSSWMKSLSKLPSLDRESLD